VYTCCPVSSPPPFSDPKKAQATGKKIGVGMRPN